MNHFPQTPQKSYKDKKQSLISNKANIQKVEIKT